MYIRLGFEPTQIVFLIKCTQLICKLFVYDCDMIDI